MVQAKSNRIMWLLKRTSEHSTPSSMAAAVALGCLAGLVPKANLLAVLLYGLIVLLPVHTLLGIGVSLAVAAIGQNLDGISHTVGRAILTQDTLHFAWQTMSELPVVPWLALHNTVVLGSFLIGICLLAPVYLLAHRVFDWLTFGQQQTATKATKKQLRSQPAESRPARPAVTAPGISPVVVPPVVVPTVVVSNPRETIAPVIRIEESRNNVGGAEELVSPSIVPPPKLVALARQTSSRLPHVADVDEEPFEPIEAVRPIINGWHIGRYSQRDPQRVSVGSEPGPKSSSMHAQATDQPTTQPTTPRAGDYSSAASSFMVQPIGTVDAHELTSKSNEKADDDNFFPRRSAARTLDRAPSEPRWMQPDSTDALHQSFQKDVMNSLELAQSASEVLAWVDDLLDECLSEEGMTYVLPESEELAETNSSAAPTSTEVDVLPQAESADGRWVMETTIEIIRWADESIPDLSAGQAASDLSARQRSQSAHSNLEQQQTMLATKATQDWNATGNGLSTLDSLLTTLTKSSTDTNASRAPMLGIAPGTQSDKAQSPVAASAKLQAASGTPSNTERGAQAVTGFQQLVIADGGSRSDQVSTLPIEPVRGECLGYLLGHLRQAREGKNP